MIDPRALDPHQTGAVRAQLQQLEMQHQLQQASLQVQQQTLMTKQSELALDACKFIVTLERDEENDVAFFSDDIVKQCYSTIERISLIFAPQIQAPPPAEPEG
jgi:hypothetical protein